MIELLLAIAELFLELFLELAGETLLDFTSRAIKHVFEEADFPNPVLASVGYGLFGILTGCMSLLLFPHPLVHPSRIHGISLIVSPVLAGVAMSLVGSMLRRRDKKVVQIESFGYGFIFAFGMALVRFLFAK